MFYGQYRSMSKIRTSLIAASEPTSVQINRKSCPRERDVCTTVSVPALIVKSWHRQRWTMSGPAVRELGNMPCRRRRRSAGTPSNCKISYIITIGAYCNFWMRKRHVSDRYGKGATFSRLRCMKVWWSDWYVKAAWETAKRLSGRSSREPWPDGYNRKTQWRTRVRLRFGKFPKLSQSIIFYYCTDNNYL